MNRYILLLTTCLVLWGTVTLKAQGDSIKSLSLNEAITFALTNSPVLKNSELDFEKAKMKVWETTAIGLPQVNAKYAYSYMLSVPEIIKGFIGGQIPGLDTLPQSVQSSILDKAVEDLRWSSTLDISASQLLFSGAYLVGLQTSRVYKGLSELAITKSKNDITESVTNSYYLSIIAAENSIIIDSILYATKNLLKESEAVLSQGFIDATTVDQISLQVSILEATSQLLNRQKEITKSLLKFQIGMNLHDKIQLTDTLGTIVNDPAFEAILLQNFNVENNVEYRLMSTQEKLMKLNLNYNRSAYLPDMVAFYNHQENFNDKAFTFTPKDMIGVNISIPIFSSGMRYAKVKQASLEYEKAQINKKQVTDGLILSYDEARSNFLTALSQYHSNKFNIEISKRIYETTRIKFLEGMASSMELSQAQSQYLNVQSAYYNGIISLVSAKSKLEKLTK